WTVANVVPDLVPRYPRDDVYFSADAQRFTMTRYFGDGHAERWYGTTATGVMVPLAGEGTVFTEGAPRGHTLLLRSAATVSLLSEDASTLRTRPLAAFGGTVHGWTAQGQLYLGRMSPTVDTSFDDFRLFDDPGTVATLPNLLGVRAFSPDGRSFAGVK